MFLLRRTAWDEVEPRPDPPPAPAGPDHPRRVWRRTSESRWCSCVFGLVYIPAAMLAGLIGALLDLIPLFDRITGAVRHGERHQSRRGAADREPHQPRRLRRRQLDGGRLPGTRRPRDRRGGRVVQARARRAGGDIAGAFGRAYAIVFLLLISTIGFPVGVFLLVRYQFIAQTVMLEDLDGRRALRRSGRLTEPPLAAHGRSCRPVSTDW